MPHVLREYGGVVAMSGFRYGHVHRTLRLPRGLLGTICGKCDPRFHPLSPTPRVARGCVPTSGCLFFLKGASPGGGAPHMLETCDQCLRGSGYGHSLLVTSLGRSTVSGVLSARKVTRVGPCLDFPNCVPGASLPTLCGNTFTFLCPSLHRDFNVPVLRSVTYNAPVVTKGASTVPRVTNRKTLLTGPLSRGSVARGLLLLRRSRGFCCRRMGCNLRHIGRFS